MKKRIWILVALTVALLGCNDDTENVKASLEGNYKGIFEREGKTSNVELDLSNQSFSGQSDTIKFPAIGKGTYSLSENTISFENTAPWTAEFDWTLILDDEWKYDYEGNQLTLTKSNGDKYVLKRE